ncbi:hypothetical protein C5167_021073 [Papaver somniferum]|uniref:KIB1-4 beta-propeller domain-containing protein n=1 Tax=Papaver somniferum TaxID=3469 RepID=A0A4Y7IZ02_PAPSO|nr:hypothetical protein C5167_021073 [Papaver somniferum]
MAEKTQATSSAALSMEERSERRSPPLPKVAPWLVIPYGKDRKNQAFYNLCDPDKRTCRKLIPELSGKSIFQKPCHHGWLVILCDFNEIDYSPNWVFADCFLWNPATLDTIQLPNIHSSGYTYDEYKLVDCVLSLPPTNPSDGNETMVFCVYERLDDECEYVFLFCRPGEKQWRTHKFTREHKMDFNFIWSLNYLKGNLYAMSYSRVCHFKVEIEQIDGDNVNLCLRQIETSYPTGSPLIGGSNTNVGTIYVQTCDELYRIDLYMAHQGKEFISIGILRLDFSTMGWKEVYSLGDTVLFYSKNTTACCSAAELGLTKGCLYYTLAQDQSLYKYELEGTGTIILPCLKLPIPWFCSYWLMMPPTFRY